ncbi:MAG: 2-amino-4-hydroxy-6-hydroxymethyldihydropteridine diphosphokinase [Bacteroidota bacterium]
MEQHHKAYLSLGSNLGNRLQNLQKGVLAINKTVGSVVKVSAVYENPALGFEGADFLNICLTVDTALPPLAILERTLEIEQQLGRKRDQGTGYSSRTLDIDIIYVDRLVVSETGLKIPHPKLTERNFVLKPLADIAPQFYHPILNKDTRNLLQECRDQSVLEKTRKKIYKDSGALWSQLQFLAIEGNIGAGKTSLAKKIAEDFNAKLVLERYADNPFLPKFYEDQSRYAFSLEMSFLADRYQQFMDDTSQFDLFKSFMVSDYDIFKSLIFAQVTLQKDEFELYRKVFNFMYKEVRKPGLYVYLNQNTEQLVRNIKNRGRTYEQGIAPAYLQKIHQGYIDFMKSHPSQQTLVIDLEHLNFVAHPKDYETLLELMEQKIVQTLFQD